MGEVKEPILRVNNLSISFPSYTDQELVNILPTIHQLDFDVYAGEIVAIVGESGSGKSLLADAIFGILPSYASVSGKIYFKGKLLTEKMRKLIRGKQIALIPQSVNALDPLMKVGRQVEASIISKDKQSIRKSIFKNVGLSDEVAKQYPFELSGGMKRRVLVATALGAKRELIVADEPTPGLDPNALHETVIALKQLVNRHNAMIFITHDIGTALEIADKIIVFKAGETVEIAEANQFSRNGEYLKEAYTKQLWQALPQNKFVKVLRENTKEVTKKQYLSVRGISYYYEKKHALLANIDFTMHTGEVVGLYGASGIGKSTFAQILSGYKNQASGTIYIDDKPLQHRNHEYIQLVWQHPEQAVNPQWKMRKVLEEAGAIDEQLLKMLEIKREWLNRRPQALSGGELQRFCVARALMTNARFLIADEMTTMLDAVTQAKIWEVILSVANKRQMGIIVISHDEILLEKLCDRTINFKDFK